MGRFGESLAAYLLVAVLFATSVSLGCFSFYGCSPGPRTMDVGWGVDEAGRIRISESHCTQTASNSAVLYIYMPDNNGTELPKGWYLGYRIKNGDFWGYEIMGRVPHVIIPSKGLHEQEDPSGH